MIGLILLLGLGAAAGGAAGVVAMATRHPSQAQISAAGQREFAVQWQRLSAGQIFPSSVSYLDSFGGRTTATLVGIAPQAPCGSSGGRLGGTRPSGVRLCDRAPRHVYRRLADRGGDDRDRSAAQSGRRAQSAEHPRGGRPRRAAGARLSRHRGELVHRQRPRDLHREEHRRALPLPLRRRLHGRQAHHPAGELRRRLHRRDHDNGLGQRRGVPAERRVPGAWADPARTKTCGVSGRLRPRITRTPRYSSLRSRSRSLMLASIFTRPATQARAMFIGDSASDTTSSLSAVSRMSAGGSPGPISRTGSSPEPSLVPKVTPRSGMVTLIVWLPKYASRSAGFSSDSVLAASTALHGTLQPISCAPRSSMGGTVHAEGSAFRAARWSP